MSNNISNSLTGILNSIPSVFKKSLQFEFGGEVCIEWNEAICIKLYAPDANGCLNCESIMTLDKSNVESGVNINGMEQFNVQLRYIPGKDIEFFPGKLSIKYSTKLNGMSKYLICSVELLFNIANKGIRIHWRKSYKQYSSMNNTLIKTVRIASTSESVIKLDSLFTEQRNSFGFNFRIMDKLKKDDTSPTLLMVSKNDVPYIEDIENGNADIDDMFPFNIHVNKGVYEVQIFKSNTKTETRRFFMADDGEVEEIHRGVP